MKRRSVLSSLVAAGVAPVILRARRSSAAEARPLSLGDFAGADPSGVADCTEALKSALDQAARSGLALHVGPGKFRLTAPVAIPFGASIIGESAGAMRAPEGSFTQFHFDHAGKGFTTSGGSNRFRGFQTLRNQPVDAPGWTAAPNDWDFYLDGVSDVFFDEILFVNATLGIIATNGGGRIWLDRIMGQPMNVGIQIDCCYDIVRLSHVHFWPYWNQGANVRAWTMSHSVGFYSKRNDDCVVLDYFHLWARRAIRIGQWKNPSGNPNLPAGTSYLLKVIGAQLDICETGYSVDEDTLGHSATLIAADMYGPQGVDASASPLIELLGTNARVHVTNLTMSAANGSAVKLAGSGNYLGITDLELGAWNGGGGSRAAFVASRTNEVRVGGHVTIGQGNGGSVFSAAEGGIFRSSLWLPFVPSLASEFGSIGSFKVNAAVFMIDESVCQFEYDISVTAAGTGSGAVLVTVPVAPAYVQGLGSGRELASDSELMVSIPVGKTVGTVRSAKIANVAQTGARLVLSGRFAV